MYIGVSVQQNQFLSKYGLRTIFFEEKKWCKGGAKADAVFCKPYWPNKVTAYPYYVVTNSFLKWGFPKWEF